MIASGKKLISSLTSFFSCAASWVQDGYCRHPVCDWEEKRRQRTKAAKEHTSQFCNVFKSCFKGFGGFESAHLSISILVSPLATSTYTYSICYNSILWLLPRPVSRREQGKGIVDGGSVIPPHTSEPAQWKECCNLRASRGTQRLPWCCSISWEIQGLFRMWS